MTEATGHDNFWTEHKADCWGDALVSSMKQGGVDNLFFVSGSESVFLQEAIVKAETLGTPAPRLITMIHETVALNAALGAAMASGKPTATSVHVDAGTQHCGGAIHTAWRGGYSVLMTAGTAPRAFPNSMPGSRSSGIQWLQEPRDQAGIVREYTKVDHRLEHTDNPGLIVSRMLQVSLSEPRGPAYLMMPRETAMLPVDGGSIRFPTVAQLGLARPTYPAPEDAKAIAEWLIEADRPLVLTDRIGRDADAVQALVHLADLLGLSIGETPYSDRMNFPASHPALGTGPTVPEADAILVLESMVPWMPGVNSPKADAKVAWVSIDPVLSRLKTTEFRADLWLPVTAANVLLAVYQAAEGLLTEKSRARIAARKQKFVERKAQQAARDERLALADGALPQPTGRWVAYQLSKLISPQTIVLNDAISNAGLIHTYCKRDEVGTYFRSGSSTGGWGSGAAVGIKLVRQEQDVVLASGDGYFSFGVPMAALWAARHHKCPYLSVIFVNGTYSTGTHELRLAFPDGYAVSEGSYKGGTFDPPPDFSKYAEAVGGYGEYVTETDRVAGALAAGLEAVRAGRPAVIAVRVPGPLQQKN